MSAEAADWPHRIFDEGHRVRGKGDSRPRRTEAAKIIATTKVEAEEIKKNAQIEGYAAGQRDGLAKGREEGSKAGHAKALADNSQAMTT